MARSTYVYVVESTPDGGYYWHPIAAFTVKHELITWLRRRESEHDKLMLTRFPDGDYGHRGPAKMDIAELLA